MDAAESDVMQQLRGRSYPHYFAALFAPAAKRGALAAVYAFQQEILHIGAQASEPLLAEMRLHYWRESLQACFQKNEKQAVTQEEKSGAEAGAGSAFSAAGQSPLIKTLAAAALRHGLPAEPFLRLTEAAAALQEPLQNCALWEKRSAAIYSGILQISCRILAERAFLSADFTKAISAACAHGGLAQGAAALLRGLPRSLREKKQPVPQDILQSLGLEPQQLYRLAAKARAGSGAVSSAAAAHETGADNSTAERLSVALCACFHQHYRAFRQEIGKMPAGLRAAFLPVALLPAFIRQIEKQNLFLFTAPPEFSLLKIQSTMLRAAIFNYF